MPTWAGERTNHVIKDEYIPRLEKYLCSDSKQTQSTISPSVYALLRFARDITGRISVRVCFCWKGKSWNSAIRSVLLTAHQVCVLVLNFRPSFLIASRLSTIGWKIRFGTFFVQVALLCIINKEKARANRMGSAAPRVLETKVGSRTS